VTEIKMRVMKLADKITGRENAGREDVGHEDTRPNREASTDFI